MKNIYVGNLDFGATEESIHSLFAPYGTVERVHLATDRETGRSRGFAFVEMAQGDADKAIAALNGMNVQNLTFDDLHAFACFLHIRNRLDMCNSTADSYPGLCFTCMGEPWWPADQAGVRSATQRRWRVFLGDHA